MAPPANRVSLKPGAQAGRENLPGSFTPFYHCLKRPACAVLKGMKPFPCTIACLAWFLLTGCGSTYQTQVVPNPSIPRVLSAKDRQQPRQMEIYFDGTSNNWKARTNVRRRFELAAQAEDPANPCLYIEGVGTDSLAGKAFGVGMKSRVLTAYKFLARHYRPGRSAGMEDRILVFGFSRGAFQSRMLTGLIAHCGLPAVPEKAHKTREERKKEEKDLDTLAEQIWKYSEEHLLDLTEKESRRGGAGAWRNRLASNRKAVQRDVGALFPGFTWSNPNIKLLAIWDTVPGLPFDELHKRGEPEHGRQRYKLGAYPNIETIVHALSLDDRRSKFEPLPVGAPVDPAATNVYEVWFPGAHSDVGGGYADSNDMAGTSFNWLHRIMKQRGITSRLIPVYDDPLALMHHPEEALVHKLTSDSIPRKVPAGAHIDRSVFRRADGNAHPEENRRRYVVYQTSNHVSGGPAHGRRLEVTQAGKTRAEQERYLASLGLVFHDDTGQSAEKALPERGAQPLSITQMAAAWNGVEPVEKASGQEKPASQTP